MNKKKRSKLLRNSSVFIIILLFIGASIIPASAGIISKNNIVFFKRQIFTASDVDQNYFNLQMRIIMLKAHFPSLVACIIKNNTVVWNRGYGIYNRFVLKPPDNTTIYMMGSISKCITATAFMHLYEQGKFNLSDNVSKFLPFDLKNPKYEDINITMDMMLSHRSSIYDHTFYPKNPIKFLIELLQIPNATRDIYPLMYELLDPDGSVYCDELWMDYPPGAETNYSNLAYGILGYVFKKIANETIEEYCKEHIFEPLGMKDTSFHVWNHKRWRMAVEYRNFLIRYRRYDFLYMATAGGIRSTIDDLSKFLIMHMNNGEYNGIRILENSTIEEMHKLRDPDSYYYSMQFGLGWMHWNDGVRDLQGHMGDTFGMHARMQYNETSDTGVIFFFNNFKIRNPTTFLSCHSKIIDLLFEKADNL
jgi:CubicO group peptidase (beta-lactamase class C family)